MTEIKEKAAVVICVYNNAAALPDVVDRAVLQKCAQVIVVDDGSTDCDVEEILKNFKLKISVCFAVTVLSFSEEK